MLEGMLSERGEDVPPANHPPMTRHGPRPDDQSPSSKNRQPQNVKVDNESPNSFNDDFMDGDHHESNSNRAEDNESAHSASSPSMLPPFLEHVPLLWWLL